VALALGVGLVCLRWWKGSRGELLLGVTALWALFAWAITGVAPGASHLFLWPALLMTAGVLMGGSASPRGFGWWLPCVAALPAVALWAPTLALAYVSLTVHAAVGLAAAATLAATLLAPAWLGASRGVAALTVVVLLGAGAGSLAYVRSAPPTADRPAVDSLFLLQDASTGEATWRSLDEAVDAWTSTRMGPVPERQALPGVLDAGGRTVLTSPARPVASPPPTVELERDERPASGEVARRLLLRVRPGADGSLRVWAHAEVAIQSATVDGRPVPIDARGDLRLSVHGVPEEGVPRRWLN
jgi:hypothetical protein